MSRKVYLSSQGWGSEQAPSSTLRPTTVAFAASLAVVATCLLSFTDILGTTLLSAPAARTQGNLHTPVFESTRESILARCATLRSIPGPPAAFHSRDESDRYEPGTNATLIRNAVIFTGKQNGTEIFHGDILLDKGIIKNLGKISWRVIENMPNLTVVDAKGAWVTPGLGTGSNSIHGFGFGIAIVTAFSFFFFFTVDLHSHLGVLSTPVLAGRPIFSTSYQLM